MTDVANGRTDVILNDYYLQKWRLLLCQISLLKFLEDVYFNPNGLLICERSSSIAGKKWMLFLEMKEDGRLKELAETYFQTDISVKSDQAIQTVETD